MRVEIEKHGQGYIYYVWKGSRIVDSCGGITDPVTAADAGANALIDHRKANKIIRRARWFNRV